MECEEQSPQHLVHLSAVSQIVYIDPTAEIHAPGSLVTPPCSWNANDHPKSGYCSVLQERHTWHLGAQLRRPGKKETFRQMYFNIIIKN